MDVHSPGALVHRQSMQRLIGLVQPPGCLVASPFLLRSPSACAALALCSLFTVASTVPQAFLYSISMDSKTILRKLDACWRLASSLFCLMSYRPVFMTSGLDQAEIIFG